VVVDPEPDRRVRKGRSLHSRRCSRDPKNNFIVFIYQVVQNKINFDKIVSEKATS
jgi:hypothetical protein